MVGQMIRGFRKKPRIIYILAILYFFLPALTLVQFALNLGDSFSFVLLKELAKSRFFLTELVCAWSAALAVLWVTPLSFFYLIGLSIYAIGIKAMNLVRYGASEFPLDLIMLSIWSVGVLLMVLTTLRKPYLNPKLQWWKQPTRYGILTRGVLYFKDMKFPIVTLNMSSGGAFLKLDERALGARAKEQNQFRNSGREERRKQEAAGVVLLNEEELDTSRKNVQYYPRKLGEKVYIKLQLESASGQFEKAFIYESEAEIAWASTPSSPYRYGLGVKFEMPQKLHKEKLKEFLQFTKRLYPDKTVR